MDAKRLDTETMEVIMLATGMRVEICPNCGIEIDLIDIDQKYIVCPECGERLKT
jgi:DNA-directed RNA polymerase subunit RPC12/RpoP